MEDVSTINTAIRKHQRRWIVSQRRKGAKRCRLSNRLSLRLCAFAREILLVVTSYGPSTPSSYEGGAAAASLAHLMFGLLPSLNSSSAPGAIFSYGSHVLLYGREFNRSSCT